MNDFSTRPELRGTFGMVATTHWIASAVAMSILEKGGNAFDAAVAAGFVLNIVEPHLNGPAGDLPAVVYSARTGRVEVICAQGPAPAKATIAHYRAEGLDLIPGDGLLATVIPGAFDGWMVMLRDYGTMPLRSVLEPAIHYAAQGHPLLPAVETAIASVADKFRADWPTSCATWLPADAVPKAGALFCNPDLARTWTRLLAAAEAVPGREAGIDAARDAFYRGFVAEEMSAWLRTAEVMDASGTAHRAVLDAEDLARYHATIEAPVTLEYGDWTLCKTGPWGQGPVLLQALSILQHTDIAAMQPDSTDFVHTTVEAMKLAYADREAYYGDPAFNAVPLDRLLSPDYGAARAALIGPDAAQDLRPGWLPTYEATVRQTLEMLAQPGSVGAVYEPTMAHLATDQDKPGEIRGDTVHIDVVDRWGNMVSATPSGGWLQSSPIIPGLGFCLNSRAQMFWLEPGLPTSLTPGMRPRTTLTPTIALHHGQPAMAFGTPGGDQQDQWQLTFFLRYAHHALTLQQAIDMPMFHSLHFPSSFHPRTRLPAGLAIESRFGAPVLDDLRQRGHDLLIAGDWDIGRLTAVRRDPDGIMRAAATPRLMQAYAIGR
ncbi:MAG TPA: gamma-glutamyltransferase family protein [Paenirhodobacter sp.]